MLNNDLIIHLVDPFYHDLCDTTYGGYTAHYCPFLQRQVEHWREKYPFTKQWIKKGNHLDKTS